MFRIPYANISCFSCPHCLCQLLIHRDLIRVFGAILLVDISFIDSRDFGNRPEDTSTPMVSNGPLEKSIDAHTIAGAILCSHLVVSTGRRICTATVLTLFAELFTMLFMWWSVLLRMAGVGC